MEERENERSAVPFYFSFIPLLEELTAYQRGELLLMILHYAQDGTMPEFEDKETRMVFKAFRPILDADKQKWTQRSRNGKRGGAPIGNTNASKNKLKQAKTTEVDSALALSSSLSKSKSSSSSSRGDGAAPRAADGNIYENLR